jgi:DNA topoisomerase II
MSEKKLTKQQKIHQALNGPVKVVIHDESDDDSEPEQAVFKVNVKKDNLKVQKMQHHEHILKRPDTYIDGAEPIPMDVYAMTDEGKIAKQNLNISAGLVRIFVEVLSNAIDNVWNSVQFGLNAKAIKINISPSEISVWNDGRNISTQESDTDAIPIPELIFGHLLTSTNYDDSQDRFTSGRNGYGVKLCNIFSKQFGLEIFNASEKTIYRQTWTDNMFKKSKPEYINKGFPKTVEDGKNGYTKVSWTPDFERFKIKEITDDMLRVYEKMVVDCAMTVQFYGVKVYLNDRLIDIKSLSDYVGYYYEEMPTEIVHMKSDDCQVVLCSNDEFTHLGFTNGVYNKDGGLHIDQWSEAIFRPILEKLNDETKKSNVNLDIRDIKKHFFLFVYAKVANPKFDDQPKSKLVGPKVNVDVKAKDIAKILKWDFVEKIRDGIKLKEMLTLKNSTERKKGKNSRIENLDDANKAGKQSEKCVLAICEGDSAASFVVEGAQFGITLESGEKVQGRDYIGILPVRGKFLNVRNASNSVLAKNKEVKAIVQSLGLVYGTDYTDKENFKKLRYQKLLICTDADVDGYHITGLLYNFFHFLFPTLLKVEGFFSFMRTPIVKITTKKEVVSFFNQAQAKEYIEKNNIKKDQVKYYKGLGTSEDDEIEEAFGKRVVDIIATEGTDKMMENVFDKETSNFRKKWISEYKEELDFKDSDDYSIEKLPTNTFLNKEMILFSIADCARSLPSVLDGLKESQRKVLYVAFLRKLNYDSKSLKVAQFANSTAELTNYHHGEDNLSETIIKMAQRFVGSNNLPLLYNEGQFGSRLKGGKDSASPRYIFTKLDMLTRLLFRPEDDPFLENIEDDGEVVEKKVYVPIVPTILLNGCGGIGTGWSCNVPCYKLEDLITWIKAWLNEEEKTDLVPFYRGFKGTVEVEGNKIITKGVIEQKGKSYVVTELPVGRNMVSISKYKEKLQDLKDDGKIKTLIDHSTKDCPNFTITAAEELNLDKLKLVDSMYTSNMVMYDTNNRLKRYNTVNDILEEFCDVRLKLYGTRKEGQLKQMRHDLLIMQNKTKFINEVLNDTIVLKGKDEEQLSAELTKKKYYAPEGGFDYLLSIQIRSMTSKRVDSLREQSIKLEKEIKDFEKLSLKQIWSFELDELLKAYPKWEDAQKGSTKKEKARKATKAKKV